MQQATLTVIDLVWCRIIMQQVTLTVIDLVWCRITMQQVTLTATALVSVMPHNYATSDTYSHQLINQSRGDEIWNHAENGTGSRVSQATSGDEVFNHVDNDTCCVSSRHETRYGVTKRMTPAQAWGMRRLTRQSGHVRRWGLQSRRQWHLLRQFASWDEVWSHEENDTCASMRYETAHVS